MNPNDENQFVVDNNKGEEVVTPLSPTTFSIWPHLAILAFILSGIFGTIIVPKTLSYIEQKNTPAVTVSEVSSAAASAPIAKIEDLELVADAAYVLDVTTGNVLYNKNGDTPLPLASITKLMTALLAYELVPDDTLITIAPQAANLQSAGTLRAGEQFKVKDLADFALTTSYNSAAYMLGQAVGEFLGDADPYEQFIAGMNIRAEELGLATLKFKNNTGLDVSPTVPGAVGSAADVSTLLAYIYSHHPNILRPTIVKSMRLYNSAGEYHEADNTNEIVGLIPGLLGSKTGYTDLAGGNLTIIFDAGFNRPIVITVLGSSHSERFTDVKKLMNASLVTLTSI